MKRDTNSHKKEDEFIWKAEKTTGYFGVPLFI